MKIINAIILLFSFNLFAQVNTSDIESYKLDEPHRVIFKKVDYLGKEAFHLKKIRKRKKNQGPDAAYLKDFKFNNGIIECDIASNTFTGIAFRAKNGGEFECVYFRPFNSNTEKHNKTVQYVAHGSKYTWNYLRKNFPGKYESSANIENNKWFHTKLVIIDNIVNVYINYSDQPVLTIKDMKYGNSNGSVGFWSHNGYFSNLVIRKD